MRITDERGRLFGKKKKISVGLLDGALAINGKSRTIKQLICKPLAGKVSFNGQLWDGSIRIILNQESLSCINTVPLGDYLFSVLRTESWPGWPLEVNKAFAIVCRSYVIKKMMESQRKPYDVRNTNHHQTYQGSHNVYSLKRAVDQTKEVFLGYNNEPILAMFDSCCGGVIPAKIVGLVDFAKAPYLARDYPCTFCRRCKIYRWSTEVPLSELRKKLMEEIGKRVTPIHTVMITKKDTAGLVKEVTISTTLKHHLLPVKKIYSMFKGVKSFCFSVYRKGKSYIFRGTGFGHHIGLCQWGTRQMVREGWDYRRILKFYYPGVQFMKIS